MKIAHVADNLSKLQIETGDPLDVGSEWEDERTILGQIEALEFAGHSVVRLNFDKNLYTHLASEKPDCVFNISEGKTGKDRESIVPAICKCLDIPCTSSDAVGMGISLDKALCKIIAEQQQIPTPKWQVVDDVNNLDDTGLNYPLFVKPVFEGSSMGIRPESLVDTREKLIKQVKWLTENIGKALIEENMPGRELTVALLGNNNPEAFPVAEIKTGNRIYDKSMKSKDRMEEEVICPAETDEETGLKLVEWSKKLFKVMGLSGLARFDYKCDKNGNPAFLEVNPLPGLSRYYSVYTIQAKAHGLSYEQMINRLTDLAIEKNLR